jgi:integrase
VFTGKPYEDNTQADLLAWIQHLIVNLAFNTVNSNKIHLRNFYKWYCKIEERSETPPILKHPAFKIKPMQSTVKPQDLPTREEVKQMLAYGKSRDRAILACLAEGGLRDSELASCNINSVQFDRYGCILFVEESKTEKRPVRLVDSTPYIKDWISQHLYKDEPDAPLFTSQSTRKRLTACTLNKLMQALALKAGIKKKLHAHLFRHYAITNEQKQGMDIVLNAKRRGISLQTLQKVYLHYNHQDADDAYLRLKGSKTSEDLQAEHENETQLMPKTCPHCQFLNDCNAMYCHECKRPVDIKSFVELDEKNQQNIEKLQEQMQVLMEKVSGERLLVSQDKNQRTIITRVKKD